jgi:hypothetical protein
MLALEYPAEDASRMSGESIPGCSTAHYFPDNFSPKRPNHKLKGALESPYQDQRICAQIEGGALRIGHGKWNGLIRHCSCMAIP